MAAQLEMQSTVLSELKTRAQQLEQQTNTLRAKLGDVMLLLDWAAEHTIPARAIESISIHPAEIVLAQQWNDVMVSEELARLFLQAHSLATRLKQLVPPNEKHPLIDAVAETFHQIAARKNLHIPVEMDVTLGD